MSDLKILVASGKPDIAKELEDQLVIAGYALAGIATCGDEAFQLAEVSQPTLVLLDVNLPGELNAACTAMQIHECLDIPVIMVDTVEDKSKLPQEVLATDFIIVPQPVDTHELRLVIEKAVYKNELERQLQASETRWWEAVEYASDLIYTLDCSGRFKSLNHAFVERLGYTSNELVGSDPLDLVVPAQRAKVGEILHGFYQGKKVDSIEVDVLKKDGGILTLEIRGRNAFDQDGNLIESFQIARDITQRREMEQQLKRSRESYRSLFNRVPIGLYRTLADGQILDANPALIEMLGFPDLETFRSESAANLYVNQQDRDREQMLLKRDGVVLDFEIQLRRWDGCVIWVQDTTQAVKDEHGQIVCYEGSLQDVTERKLAEATLERRVQELGALYDTSLEINAQKDLSSLLCAIVERAATLVGVPKGGLYLLRPDGETLELVVGYNLPEEFIGTVLKVGDGLSGLITQTGEAIMVEDYTSWHGKTHVYDQEGYGRVLGVPLKKGDRVIGVINVADDSSVGPFSEDDIRLVSLFADQAAIAVENVRLYEESQHEITERKRAEESERTQRNLAEALRDTAEALNSTLDLNQVLDHILIDVESVVKKSNITIMLIEEGEARIVRARGYDQQDLEEIIQTRRLKVSEASTLRMMAESGEPVIVPDTLEHPGWVALPDSGWIRSYAGAPIMLEDQVVGFINMASAELDNFSEAEVIRLKAFADQAAVAIRNARLFGETERYARNMGQLNEITRAALGAPDLASMTQSLADHLGEMFKADHVHITMWDEANKRTVPMAAYGPMRDDYPSLEFPPGELTLTESILNHRGPLVIDGYESPYYSPRIGEIYPAQSKVGFPLIADGNKLGAMIIRFNEQHSFSQEEINLGEQAAGQVALAISRLQSLEAERQRSTELTRANSLIMALGQVATRMDSAPDPENVMKTMGAELNQLDVYSLVALLEPGTQELTIHFLSFDSMVISFVEKLANVSLSDYRLSTKRFNFYHQVIADRQPIFTTDPGVNIQAMLPGIQEPLINQILQAIQVNPSTKGIYLPLIVEEKVFGTLWMWGENLEQSDLPAASVFASQLSVALENARLYNITQQLAITDDLTGFYNRRGLFELGRREVERSLRLNHSLSIIMVDIDHFKLVNDLYGHAAGDDVLRQVARRWREALRGIDIIGRYGGEEFMVLLPETKLATAYQVAERMRQRVVQVPISTVGGKVSITVSLGVAMLQGVIMSLEELIADADKALYLAKQAGRNRVAVLGE
jgi:diguanylate cyclase (GGDEF)-like protein/PAS domain S-box-containing protein